MNTKQAAAKVYQDTQPIDWHLEGRTLTSPPAKVAGHDCHVVVMASRCKHLFPLVTMHGTCEGRYRVWWPWSWPCILLWLHRQTRRDKRQGRKLWSRWFQWRR